MLKERAKERREREKLKKRKRERVERNNNNVAITLTLTACDTLHAYAHADKRSSRQPRHRRSPPPQLSPNVSEAVSGIAKPPGTGLRSSVLSDCLLRSRRSSDTPFVSRKAAKPPASGPTVLPIVSRESAKPQSRWLPIWSSRPSPTKPPASSPLILRPPGLRHRCPPPILPIISREAAKSPAQLTATFGYSVIIMGRRKKSAAMLRKEIQDLYVSWARDNYHRYDKVLKQKKGGETTTRIDNGTATHSE